MRPRLLYSVTSGISARNLLQGQPGFFRRAGFDVTVCSAPGPNLDAVAEEEGVATVPLPFVRAPAPLRDIGALAATTSTLRRIRPHVVHASTPKAGLLTTVASRAARVPFCLYLLRGLRLEGIRGPRQWLLSGLENVAMTSAHRVYCNSESLRRRAAELGLRPTEKMTVVGAGSSNGVDTIHYRPRPEEGKGRRLDHGIPVGAPVVGFVGRLTRDKGLGDLVSLCRQLRGRHPDLWLLVVGGVDDTDRPDPRALEWIEADDRTLVTGWVKDTALYYPMMDVLVFPSYREGLPNAPLEAAASGIPTVGYQATGTVDAVASGETGILVPVRDTGALLDGVDRVLSEEGLADRLGSRARRWVKDRYDRERVWEAWLAELDGILAGLGISRPPRKEDRSTGQVPPR